LVSYSFDIMPNPENIIPPKHGEVRNPNGRPKGSKNRSTIARKWLETIQSAKNPITGEDEKLSQEDLMTLALLKKARNGDVAAYKQLMDSGYGMPTQQIEHTGDNRYSRA
jgi:hypothetical protein